MFKKRVGLLCAGSIAALCGCSSDDNTTTDLLWSACESSSTLECANLQVPLDYGNNTGEKISLALIRMPAQVSTRKGTLLFNPGGPGGSGVELIKIFDEIDSIPESVKSAYDIVGFDPRGVGASTPVDCAEYGLDDVDPYPLDVQAVITMHQHISRIAAACSEKHGAYLQRLGSLNVVRDMEQIRQSLNEDKLNFIGYSYGTRLAALYLQEYPQNSGRMVLDGSVLPDSSVTRLVQESLPALQSNLRLFLSRCTTTDPGCSVERLITRLNDRVIALAGNASEAAFEELELFGELIIPSVQKPELGLFTAEAIIEYLNTYDVEILVRLETLLESLGAAPDEDSDNETAQIAVMCADDAYRPTADELIAVLAEMNAISDPFAEAQLPQVSLCAGWPEALEPLTPISTRVAPLSLVIGGTTDTQTPLEWSHVMAQAIGGVFIRSEHLGHTATFAFESDCIDALVATFLIDGLTPSNAECD